MISPNLIKIYEDDEMEIYILPPGLRSPKELQQQRKMIVMIKSTKNYFECDWCRWPIRLDDGIINAIDGRRYYHCPNCGLIMRR